jgi:hypothetical protein
MVSDVYLIFKVEANQPTASFKDLDNAIPVIIVAEKVLREVERVWVLLVILVILFIFAIYVDSYFPRGRVEDEANILDIVREPTEEDEADVGGAIKASC